MSPVNGQQLQSTGDTSGSTATNSNNTAGDSNLHRHPPPHHPQMHHMGPPPGPPQPGTANGGNTSGGGHMDSPGEGSGTTERRHQILPPCPLEKPPRGKQH